LRSHRRLPEYLLSAFGILPWRCFECKRRFYGNKVPLCYLAYAHCGKCGNLELITIRRDRLDGGWPAWLAVHLGAHPLRCEDCRNNFVSWRSLWSPRPHHATGNDQPQPLADSEETVAGQNPQPDASTEAD
jgi:hypothetical protein